MKKSIVSLVFIAFLSFSIFAQSSEKITEILNTEKVTFGQISYLAGTYTSRVQEDADYESAFETMRISELVPNNVKSTDIARLDDIAYLFCKISNMNGGIFYKFFDSKRYAFKELKARSIIPQNSDPSLSIDGHDVFAILNECISE